MPSTVTKTRKLTREKLASFLGNQELIKAFENITDDLSGTLPGAVDQAIADAAAASAAAALALAAATAAQTTANAALLAATVYSGTALLDFGVFPGASDASIVVAGQPNITAGSRLKVSLKLEATADHSADEHLVETLRVSAGTIVPAVGFTIYGVNVNQINDPARGASPRIYGLWSVAWEYQ